MQASEAGSTWGAAAAALATVAEGAAAIASACNNVTRFGAAVQTGPSLGEQAQEPCQGSPLRQACTTARQLQAMAWVSTQRRSGGGTPDQPAQPPRRSIQRRPGFSKAVNAAGGPQMRPRQSLCRAQRRGDPIFQQWICGDCNWRWHGRRSRESARCRELPSTPQQRA